MANEIKNTAPVKVIATTSSKIKEIVIENGQLLFVQDAGRIAFDFNDKRVFYNQITELNTEYERTSLSNPLNGYYFIIETAILWSYNDEWVQISGDPSDVLFVGVELPELGQEKKLYVDKLQGEISVWDGEINDYIVVSDLTQEATSSDIEKLFS